MTDHPRVSVVIPCFNATAFLPALARTLVHNAGDGIEFVLVNDASTDGTAEVIDRMSTEIRGARSVHRGDNGGLAAARNTGIDAALGRYIAFLDADDWLHPGHVGRLVAAIEHHQTDFVRTDHVAVDGRKRRIVRSPEMRRSQPLKPRAAILPVDRSSGVDYPYSWAGIFDVERMGKDAIHFDDGLHTAEDRPWIWRIYRNATSHAVVSLTGNYYRRGVANSLTQIADARQLHFFEAFDLVISETSLDAEAEMLMPKAIRSYCAIMSHHLKLRERFDGPLQAELIGRTAKTLRALPQSTLNDVFHGMGDKRAHELRALRDTGMAAA